MTNYFRELHPWSTALYMFMALFLVMTSEYNIIMMLIFFALSLNDIYIRGVLPYLKSLGGYLVVIIVMAGFNVIFNHNGDTPFLYINDIPLTVESFTYGLFMGVMICSLLLWFKIFNDIFDSRKITYMIGKRLPVTGLIISMVFCYYEKFLSKIDKIKEVWDTYGTEKRFGKVKNAGIILSVLLSVMLEDSVDTAMSMSARGYGRKKRTDYIRYHYSIMDSILMILSVCGFLFIIVLKTDRLYFVTTIFLMIPVIYNIYKEIEWKYYLSKI